MGPPYSYFFAFGSFAANVEILIHGPIIKNFCDEKIQPGLDHSQQNFSFGCPYTNREHNHTAADAGIHLAKLMNGQFDIEQAKDVSIISLTPI